MQAAAARNHQGPKIRIKGEVAFECFVGTKLIGCNSTLAGIVNGAFLIVTAIHEGGRIRVRDEDIGAEFDYSPVQLAKHTRLRWALTVCSVQGRSLPGTIAIHDIGSRHFDATHLYVALSRATDGRRVHIAS
jgi:ATP-dependent exoDNAse (exonuclease V) alpha subunit